MKKLISGILALCFMMSTASFSAEISDYTNRDILEGIGRNFSTFGVYGGFDSEELYLDTLAEIVDNHPELYTEVLKKMMSAHDKYGAYYTPEEAQDFEESLSDSILGIGVIVTAIDGNFIISQVFPGTPAEAAGISEGDILLFVNGTSVSGMDIDEVTNLIKGPVGTPVSVVASRNGIGEITFNMLRAEIETLPVEYEILEENIGYIQIYTFATNTAVYVNNALKQFSSKGIKNVIIDVRNNGGGYLVEAVAVADLFLPAEKVIVTEDQKLNLLDKTYIAKGIDPGYKVVVLINGNSASASEVLTAALMENNAATSIGETSFGKGTVQNLNQLPDGGLIKYTTAFYLTPNGRNIEGKGIEPNINVENTTEYVDLSQFTELSYKNTYSVGMSSPEIKSAKEMLNFIGLYQGEINEQYDENMRIAVSAFQKATNLAQTGVLDPVTQIGILQILSETRIVVDNQLEQAKLYLTEE